MTSIEIVTFNVDGLNDIEKRHTLLEYFNRLNVDIIALQETHITQDNIDTIKREWKYQSIWNPAPSPYTGGTAILLGSSLKKTAHKTDQSGRILTMQIKSQHTSFQLTNIYAPTDNQHKEHFFNQIDQHMFNNRHTVLTGDFNMVEDPSLDRNPPCRGSSYTKGLNNLNKIKQKHKLSDTWRKKHPGQRKFTWKSRKVGDNTASRIDRCYISDNITFISQHILKSAHSDHSILLTKLIIQSNTPRGDGYWKLNTKVLEDPQYQQSMGDILRAHVYDDQNPTSWMDIMKHKAQQHTARYCKQKNKTLRIRLQNIEDRLDKERDPDKLEQLSLDVLDIRQEMNSGALIRSREKTILNEDKPTKYFYIQEETRQKKTHIKELHTLDQQGNITNIYKDEDSVLDELHRYHTKLYQAQETDSDATEYFINLIDKYITEQQKRDLDRSINIDDLKYAIKMSQRNRSPGPDGIPVEFYDTFIDILGESMVKV